MASKCDHSLCHQPATVRASISDNGREWMTGLFCSTHGLAFVANEPFTDVALLYAIPASAFIHQTEGHA